MEFIPEVEEPFDPEAPIDVFGWDIDPLPPGSVATAVFIIVRRLDADGGAQELSFRASGNLAPWECKAMLNEAYDDVEMFQAEHQHFLTDED